MEDTERYEIEFKIAEAECEVRTCLGLVEEARTVWWDRLQQLARSQERLITYRVRLKELEALKQLDRLDPTP